MLLKALTLENFKGIREPVRIEFAPITLLFGANNAGKSTVVQALMYAREVLERNNCDAYKTQLGGDAVDLGGFTNMVHGHDRSRVIRMRFEMRLRDDPLVEFLGSQKFLDLLADIPKEESAEEPKENPATEFLSQRERAGTWVEIQIAWDDAIGPYVCSYLVGHNTNPNPYATIRYVPSSSDLASQTNEILLELDFSANGIGEKIENNDVVDKLWLETKKYYREIKKIDTSFLCEGDESKEGSLVSVLAMRNTEKLLSYNIMKPFSYALLTRELTAGSSDLRDGNATEYLQVLKEALDSYSTENNGNNNDRKEKTNLAAGDRPKYFDSWLWDLVADNLQPNLIPIENKTAISLSLDQLGLRSGTALPKWDDMLSIPHADRADIKIADHEKKQKLEENFEYLRKVLSEIIVSPGAWLVEELTRSAFLSAQREAPPRSYRHIDKKEKTSWWNGRAAWDWLINRDDQIITRTNAWLNAREHFDSDHVLELVQSVKLDLDDSIIKELTGNNSPSQEDVKLLGGQISRSPIERQLYFRNTASGTRIAACDVGAGLAQIVPIIVAALVHRLKICAIEEPEAKLHPRFQVVLADLFISAAVSRFTDKEVRQKLESEISWIKTQSEDKELTLEYMRGAAKKYAALRGKPDYHRWFLVETHSEYLLLRCLRRIRESINFRKEEIKGALKPEDLAVHFFDSSEDGTRVHKIRIDDDGEFLDPWPQGFFPERGKEIFGDDS